MLATNLGDLFSRILARIYSHNYRRSPKYSKIKQQILLYCTISSETTRFVDFIGKKPTNLGIIITMTITLKSLFFLATPPPNASKANAFRDILMTKVSKITIFGRELLHFVTTWWPLGDRLVTAWWPLGDRLVTAWWPFGDHLVTTWWLLVDHLVTTSRPLDDNKKTTWWPLDDHLVTTSRPLGDHLVGDLRIR